LRRKTSGHFEQEAGHPLLCALDEQHAPLHLWPPAGE
jgi:hypothetical protein